MYFDEINRLKDGEGMDTYPPLENLCLKGNAMHLNDSYPTEFYVSDTGYLVLKQDCFECGRLTQFLISPEQTKVLFNLLPDLMKQQKESWTGLYQPEGDDNV